MKHVITIVVALSLASCDKKNAITEPQALNALSFEAAEADVNRYLGNGAEIVAICGPSVGSVLFVDNGVAKLERDEIKNGVVGFGFDKDGKPDIVRRDAMKVMIRLSEDGGMVTYNPLSKKKGLGTWTVSYPSTGVAESYVLGKRPDGSVVSIWTSAKPEIDAMLPPRGLLMFSKCKVVNAQTH